MAKNKQGEEYERQRLPVKTIRAMIQDIQEELKADKEETDAQKRMSTRNKISTRNNAIGLGRLLIMTERNIKKAKATKSVKDLF
jgi:hypothetical protein